MGWKVFVVFSCILVVLFNIEYISYSKDNGITQGEFAKRLISVLGIEGKLPQEPQDTDYIEALKSEGIEPKDGYKIDKVITRDEISYILTQVTGVDMGKEITDELQDKIVIEGYKGNAEVRSKEDSVWIKAENGMILVEKYSIKTGENSSVSLRIGTIASVLLRQNAELSIDMLKTQPEDFVKRIVFHLKLGQMIVDARGVSENHDFKVVTPSVFASMKDTIYSISATHGKGASVDLIR